MNDLPSSFREVLYCFCSLLHSAKIVSIKYNMHASEALAVFQNWLSPRPPRTFIADQSISRGPGGSVVFEWIRVEKDGKLQPVLEATYDLSHEFNKTGGATPPL